ncbi:MAG TPA: hypothetical protein VFE42_11565 [Chloroflexota bacterium]|nr:hypothetical protein [Chloroflexota bacterium]
MDALTTVDRWLHLLAMTLWCGGVVMLFGILRPRRRPQPDLQPLLEAARRRVRALIRWAILAAIITLAAEVLLRVQTKPGEGYVTALRDLLFGQNYGLASVVRWVSAVAALWISDELVRLPSDRWLRLGSQTLGIVAGGPRTSAAPSQPRQDRNLPSRLLERGLALMTATALLATAVAWPLGSSPFSLPIGAIRLASMTTWFGGTLLFPLAVAPFLDRVESDRRPMALVGMLERFAPVVFACVPLLILSDLWAAGQIAVNVPAYRLWLLVLAAMIAVSLWGALVLRQRIRRFTLRARRDPTAILRSGALLPVLRRQLWINPALVVLALGLNAATPATRTTAVPPPVPALTGASTVSLTAGSTAIRAHISPNAAGLNSLELDLADGAGAALSGAQVTVQAHSLERAGLDPPPTQASELGNGRYLAPVLLTAGGHWTLRVSVRAAGSASTDTADLAVAAQPLARPLSTVIPPTADKVVDGSPREGTWQALGPNTIARALLVDPADHARLYLATASDGVYSSGDAGAHWSRVVSGLDGAALSVWSLTMLPDGSLIAATGDGVYRSTDQGGHWKPAGLRGRSIYTLATHQFARLAILAGGEGGIYRSDDLGTTWRQLFKPAVATSSITSLAWPGVRPSLIVAGLAPGDQPLVLSRDGGATWRYASAGLPEGPGLMSVAVAPGARDAYAGSMGLGAYASVGLSGAWQERIAGLPGLASGSAHISSFAFDPAHPATIYAATPYGVYRSVDAGRHWRPFGAGFSRQGSAEILNLTIVGGPHAALYAATAAGLYRLARP